MAPVAYKTCDVCRKRKTKCIPATEDQEPESNTPCTNCTRLGITCTYDHKYKKPGRPSSYVQFNPPPSFAKAASESSGRESATDVNVKGERLDSSRGSISHGTTQNQAPGYGQVHEGNTDAERVRANGGGSGSGGRSQSSGDMPRPSGLSNHHDPGQPLRRLSEVALAPPTDLRLSTYDPPTRSSGPTLSVGLNANSSHPGPFLSSSTLNHPTATSIPFGPIPNSLAPPSLLGPPSSALSPQLPHLDAFDFASAFHPYDEHEDGGENDLAIDWPTMSSGNGAGQVGTVRPDGSSGPPSGGVPGDLHFSAQGQGSGQGQGPGQGSGTNNVNAAGLHTGYSPISGTINTSSLRNGSSNKVEAPTLALHPPSSTASSIPRPRIRDSDRDFQIEDIVPWHTISFFITIYLGYSHSLFPMVHRPSFSQKLALRVDKRDKDFRALVLGIVAYTIGQSPLSRMTASFTRPELSALQHRCHRGSMMLLDRSFRDPNVLQVATLSAGYFYCQSVGKTTRALTLLSEACQLMHLLHMHDDDATAAMGLDAVEIQMRRRIWWHVYAVDITEASAGQMIHLNSFEGQPSFPSEIDDEYLTAQGSFPQPIAHTSYIVGLVACVRLFPVLEQVLQRSRTLRARTRQRRYMTAAEIASEVDWIAGANAEVDGIMRGLPEVLKMGWTVDEDMDEIRLAVMGMQRANMAITAVSIRFALADYRAELEPHSHSADADRASMGREAYHTLSIIPLDDLAANGESMRGKIFRILLALLKSNGDSSDWVATLQDWWTLFSRVQFVQLMTSNVESRLPSPEPGAAA